MLNKFIKWFEKDSPNFTVRYGEVLKFYDKGSDEFHIQEIQTAYNDFKKGKEPHSLYRIWGIN